MTKIDITYQSNYNGCTVFLIDGNKTFYENDQTHGKKISAVQDAIIECAFKDVIKSGRHEGEFNGDVDELEEFAIKTAKEQFGADVEVVFEEDSSST